MLEKLRKYQAYQQLKKYLSSITFASGMSLWFLLITFLNKMKEDDIQTMAGAIAFNFTLSLFPGIIFLFTLIPYFPIEDLTENIQFFMQESLPETVYQFTWDTIEDIIAKPRGGLLSFGFIMALYLSKNGMLSIMTAFNSVYRTSETSRSFIKKQLIAIALTAMSVFAVFLAVVVLVLGEQITHLVFDALQIEFKALTDFLIGALRYVVILLMFLLILSVIYRFAPSVQRKFRFFSPGSFMATVLILLAAKLFAFYVDNFGSYNKLYGSIGALLGLMFFFYAISLIILVGFQVNASIDMAQEEVAAAEAESA